MKQAEKKAAADIREKLQDKISTLYGRKITFQPGGSVLKRTMTPDSDFDVYVVLDSGRISRDSASPVADMTLLNYSSAAALEKFYDVVREIVQGWQPAQGEKR